GRSPEQRLSDIKSAMVQVLIHLRDWTDIDKISWECLSMDDDPTPPVRVADRRKLALRNVSWLWHIIREATASTNGLDDSEAIDDVRLCLVALHVEFLFALDLEEQCEEAGFKKPLLKELSRRLAHIRRVLYTPILMAHAKLALHGVQKARAGQEDQWSPAL